jgi:hypothetical protein
VPNLDVRWWPEFCFYGSMPKKVLFLSNGHGEDVNGSMVAQALQLQDPTVQIGATPIGSSISQLLGQPNPKCPLGALLTWISGY